jgi:hypothetical protein
MYPSGFDLIPRIFAGHRISACIDDLPPNWITQSVIAVQSTGGSATKSS